MQFLLNASHYPRAETFAHLPIFLISRNIHSSVFATANAYAITGTHGIGLAVEICLSVRSSNACIVIKRKKLLPTLYSIGLWKNDHPSFPHTKNCWWRTSTLWNFVPNRPRSCQNADFQP